MRKVTARLLAVALLTVTLTASTGCLVIAAGAVAAGTVAYVKGDLEATLNGSISEVEAATVKGLADLKLEVKARLEKPAQTIIKSEQADGGTITITINKLSEETCNIKIRVGVFGNEPYSREIFARIEKHL